MKICVTRTSDGSYQEIKEYDNLDQCVEELLTYELYGRYAPEVVVSKPADWKSASVKECDYVVEIYDTWRE